MYIIIIRSTCKHQILLDKNSFGSKFRHLNGMELAIDRVCTSDLGDRNSFGSYYSFNTSDSLGPKRDPGAMGGVVAGEGGGGGEGV